MKAHAAGVTWVLMLSGIACFSEEPDFTDPGDDTDVVVIEMTQDLSFRPQHVEVRAGQTIRWRNVSNMPHTSTALAALASDPGHVELPSGAEGWNSGAIAPGGTYDLVLTVSGDYGYFCDPHELAAMIGTITVTP